jgi:hypothetical protein
MQSATKSSLASHGRRQDPICKSFNRAVPLVGTDLREKPHAHTRRHAQVFSSVAFIKRRNANNLNIH